MWFLKKKPKPKSLEEFISMTEKRNGVVITGYFYDGGGSIAGLFDYHCLTVLSSVDGIKFKSHEFVHHRMGNLNLTKIGKWIAELYNIEEALPVANKLVSEGFQVTVNGKSVEFLRDTISRSWDWIEKQCNELRVNLEYARGTVEQIK